MKRGIKGLLLFLIICIYTPVFAVEHQVHDVIPVGESATVKTELFTYTEMSYSPTVTGKNSGRFSFQSITNNSSSSVPISINILLFDTKMENIGFVTYCTDQDLGGEYNQKKLGPSASSSFYINVTSRYFIDDKGPNDVMYYAVYDENKYCHVGGYDQYAGLTMGEILNGSAVTKSGDNSYILGDTTLLEKMSTYFLLVVAILVGGLVVLIVQGMILNSLYMKMYGKTSIFSYIIITNQYIAVKLAFGKKVAGFYIIAYIISILISFVIPIFASLVSVVSTIAFVIDIIKLITKNYTLAFMDSLPTDDTTITVEAHVLGEEEDDEEEENTTEESEEDNTEEEESNGEEDTILNLNYEDGNTIPVPVEQDEEQSAKSEKKVADGESDLMNLFK